MMNVLYGIGTVEQISTEHASPNH